MPNGSIELWEEDITYIWRGCDGWCYLFNILDCFTREWLAYVFAKLCRTADSVRCLDRAIIEIFPKGDLPTKMALRKDGGPQYTSARFFESLQSQERLTKK